MENRLRTACWGHSRGSGEVNEGLEAAFQRGENATKLSSTGREPRAQLPSRLAFDGSMEMLANWCGALTEWGGEWACRSGQG